MKSFVVKLLFFGCLVLGASVFAFAERVPLHSEKPHFQGDMKSELPLTRVEKLGNPWEKRYAEPQWRYARNIWSMRWFNNRLYVGGGNSSNKGPAINAGPVPILAFDESTAAWVEEGEVDDEQIDRFVLLDGKLAIPGHDPRQSWKLGNLYIREASGRWKKHRNIPDAVHTYDVTSHSGSWYAALGTAKEGAIAHSSDQGKSWNITRVTPTRSYTFLKIGSDLYAMPALRLRKGKTGDTPFVLEDGVWKSADELTPTKLFPMTKLKADGVLKILKSANLGQQTVYIGGYVHNDHQSLPFGVYVTTVNAGGKWEAQKLDLPKGFEPWDIVQRENAIYLLLNRRAPETADVQIWRALVAEPNTWIPVLALTLPGFARALEERAGLFYIGTGSEIEPKQPPAPQTVHPQTGLILRVQPVSDIPADSNQPPSNSKKW